jgi:hypothetical protein
MSFVQDLRGRATRVSFGALCVAVLWSLVLVVGAFAVPVYSSESCSATLDGSGAQAECVSTSSTLVAVNGLAAVVAAGLPLVVTLLAGVGLRSGSRGGRAAAWALVGLLAVFTVLALLSIGILLLPTTMALVVACAAARLTLDDPTPQGAT